MNDNLLLIIQILFVLILFLVPIIIYFYYIYTIPKTSPPANLNIIKAESIKAANIANIANIADIGYVYFNHSDIEYDGNALLDYKCLKNVSFSDCLTTCANSQKCIGTEWNPLILENVSDNTQCMYDPDYAQLNKEKYYMIKNVCCPLTSITNKTTRSDKNQLGTFYIKSDQQSTTSSYVAVNNKSVK